jgi:hypothetical protein
VPVDFERHVYAVQRYVQFTQPRYEPLFKSGVTPHPICCFGDPATAVVVTVGANPSVGELENGSWPRQPMAHTALAERCRGYFSGNGATSHHKFFKPWKQGLECLGVSYESGGAVHVDLSPRATRYISDLKPGFENELFLEMVQQDLWMFFATLDLCSKAKVLLMAGSVTGRYFMNEFLQRFAPDYGHALGGAFVRGAFKGPGKTCWHELSNSKRKLPTFFCSSGPASRTPGLLPQRVCENASRIMPLLE